MTIETSGGIGVGRDANVGGDLIGRDKYTINIDNSDKRLQTLQEAYTLWQKLVDNVYKGDMIGDVVIECQTWWTHNCLHLPPDVRYSFRKAYQNALEHGHYVEARADIKLIKENWSEIIEAREKIVASANALAY